MLAAIASSVNPADYCTEDLCVCPSPSASSLLFLCANLWAQAVYRVERVIDGDTVVLAGLGTVRLIGVDTPETVDPRKPVEQFGKEASAFLTGFLAGKSVRLEYDQTLKDKYNRTLAYLYLPDGTFVNREIVRQGYGHAYTQFPFRYMEDFRSAEREARSAQRGLWGVEPTSPVVLTPAPTSGPSDSQATETVYVTRTGTRYHRDGCRSLSRSKIARSLKDAAASYGPCAICKPPVPATSSIQSATPAPATSRSTSTAATRCQAQTKAGTQCSRNARAGSSFCWQHGG